MTSHIKKIDIVKEDLKIIKERLDNIDKNINEVRSVLIGSQDIMKQYTHNIDRINKEKDEKIEQVKSSWWWS